MKKIVLLVAAVLVAGLAFADGSAKTAPAKGKTHDVQAEIVSVDAASHTMMVKGEKGDMKVPCMGKAADQMKKCKAGDKVTLVCQDNEKGEHTGATEIKMAEAPKK